MCADFANRRSKRRASRGRRVYGGWTIGLIGAFALVWLAYDVVDAQLTPPTASATMTDAEEEALELYRESRLIGARRAAETALRHNPDSMVGHFVMGCVMRESEGALPAAMFHLGRARQLYEDTWPLASPPPDAPWQLHREIIFNIQELAQELEAFEYRLQMIEFYDDMYMPKLHAQRAWALLSLEEFDEARVYARRATEVADATSRSQGYNALCAIETEARRRHERDEACQQALLFALQRAEQDTTHDPSQVTNVAVHAYNASNAALGVLAFDEAERRARDGVTRLNFTPANPWRQLARRFTDEGRMLDAARALDEMDRWRRRQPPYLRDAARAETESVLATVMLVAGRTDIALRAIDRAVERPDRRGLHSSTSEQAQGAHALVRRAVRRVDAEIARERASLGEGPSRWERTSDAVDRRAARFADDARIISALSDRRRLVSTLRPYLGGGLDPVPTWLLGDLVEVLGPGVFRVALDMARSEESDPAFDPYFDALEAEVHFSRGAWRRTSEVGARAFESLPAAERLLRARVAALVAYAEWRSGTDALTYFGHVLALDPGTLRRLGIRLPARVESGGGQYADALVERLRRSPRLRITDGAFSVTVEESGASLHVCLLSVTRDPIVCSSMPLTWTPESTGDGDITPEDAERAENYDPVIATGMAFHMDAFSMPLQFETLDLGSLDGRTSVNSNAARERLLEAFDRISAPGQ